MNDAVVAATFDAPAATSSALVRHWAAASPNSVAYTFEGVHTTFADFDIEVDRWAKALLALGIKRDEGVSILAGNHPDFLRLAFAAARIGAHLAPLNTWFKSDELRWNLHHADSVALFTADRLRSIDFRSIVTRIVPELVDSSEEHPLQSVDLPDLRHVISLGSALPGSLGVEEFLQRGDQVADDELRAREAENRAEDLMYLLYTSGTTSKPKAVMLHQGDMIENTYQIGIRQGVGPEDRIWVATPLFYGLSAIQALFTAWSHGARVVLQEAFNASEALELIESQRCTGYYGFGNITRKLLAEESFDKSRIYLRKGLVGFSEEDRKLAREELGITQGSSVYGMTETYGLAALTAWDDDTEVFMTTQGYPLPGQDIRIVDPITEKEVDDGQVGALLVKGRVTSGYYKDPERTAAAFTSDGFLRTGDMAMKRHDGRIVYHSRESEMMKPGGINVSPIEVEALLDTVPGVKQAHICSIPDKVNGEVVVAFLEADADIVTPQVIRQHISERAASYKVPAIFHYRNDNEIPRLANGKVPRPRLVEEALRLRDES